MYPTLSNRVSANDLDRYNPNLKPLAQLARHNQLLVATFPLGSYTGSLHRGVDDLMNAATLVGDYVRGQQHTLLVVEIGTRQSNAHE